MAGLTLPGGLRWLAHGRSGLAATHRLVPDGSIFRGCPPARIVATREPVRVRAAPADRRLPCEPPAVRVDAPPAAQARRGCRGPHAGAVCRHGDGRAFAGHGPTGGRAHLRARHDAAPDAHAAAGIHLPPHQRGRAGRRRPRREDRRTRRLHEGRRRCGRHDRAARADSGDHRQQPDYRRDARDRETHGAPHGLGRPRARQSDGRRRDRRDRFGVLAAARSRRQGRRARVDRAAPARSAAADDSSRRRRMRPSLPTSAPCPGPGNAT